VKSHIPRGRALLEKLTVTLLVNKFPAFYGNPKFSLPFSQKPTTGPLIQMNPAHTYPPCFPKIRSNIIFQFTPRFLEWSLPFRFYNQNFVRYKYRIRHRGVIVSCAQGQLYLYLLNTPSWYRHFVRFISCPHWGVLWVSSVFQIV